MKMLEKEKCRLHESNRDSRWDRSSHEEFYDYYARASTSHKTLERFASIRDMLLRVVSERSDLRGRLEVADIGCGAGTQCIMWAELGHHVHGLDLNEPLVKLAKTRADKAGCRIDFCVASALELPWSDESVDICLALELLEHIRDWRSCLNEFTRIIRPGGILCLTTTNKLCPFQQEFDLPLYSWYPSVLKRHYEHLAVTRRPELVEYAKYPAVNWFSFYSLRTVLASRGFRAMDRFDVAGASKGNILKRLILSYVRVLPPVRWLAHVATPGTLVVAIKDNHRSK